MTGTIIGVGFFSLPFILASVGVFFTLFYFLLVGTVVVLIHQFFGELALVTPDQKRMPGFAKYHLGNWAEKISLLSAMIGFYGTLLAYLILGGNFLANSIGMGETISILIYFFLGSIFIFFDSKAISKIEFLDVFLFSIILLSIFIFGKNFLDFSFFLSKMPTPENFFLPYGPILFSLWGAAIIPEIEEMLGEKKILLKKTIFISIFIAAIFYFIFSFFVSAICKTNTSSNAIFCLKEFLPPKLIKFFFFFGLVTTLTSFVALGLTLKKIFWYDFRINKNFSFLLTLLPPFSLFFLGLRNFLPVISFVGSVCLGTDGVLILLMYQKAFKEKLGHFKKFLVYLLILFLFFGIFYEMFYFNK